MRWQDMASSCRSRNMPACCSTASRRLDPQADTGTGLDKQYDLAVGLRGGA